MNNIAVERFNRAEDAGKANPKDALTAAIEELEGYKITSVMVICIAAEDDTVTYFAGPHVSTLRKVWFLLQREILRVIERMLEE